MLKRKLGKSGLEVSAIGLGCMGMSTSYGRPKDKKEMSTLLQAAVDRGVTFFDTAEVYGPFKNEELLGEALSRWTVVCQNTFTASDHPTFNRFALTGLRYENLPENNFPSLSYHYHLRLAFDEFRPRLRSSIKQGKGYYPRDIVVPVLPKAGKLPQIKENSFYALRY